MEKGKRKTVMVRVITLLTVIILGVSCNINYHVRDNSYIKDLDGKWKFSIGDDTAWANPGFDDSGWDNINVPSAWEDDGYVGYDGFAWYRLKLGIPSYLNQEDLFLELGQIDDVDEIYLNGYKIGSSGSFPPYYKTAYNEERHYYLPKELLNKKGENVIAVRVYDEGQSGGIVGGRVAICTYRNTPEMLVSLSGEWKFSRDDDPSWSSPGFVDTAWAPINLPNTWESQGYTGYDGFGWFRHQFETPEGKDEGLVLMLGNIDDIDQVFVNGKLIGSTGEFGKRIWSRNSDDWDKYWLELRGYEIPKGLLKPGGKNIVAVRVFDQGGYGGIFNGPLGIVTNKEYEKYEEKYERFSNSIFHYSGRHIVINNLKF